MSQKKEPDSKVIPLLEEVVRFDKREQAAGKVRVAAVVEEHEAQVETVLNHDIVDIERVPVGQEVNAMPEIRSEGDVLIIPVVEERAVVSKQLFLVEEIRIRKSRMAEVDQVPVKLKRHKLQISDETGATINPTPSESS